MLQLQENTSLVTFGNMKSSQINPNLYFMLWIIALKFEKDWFPRTRVIVQKPLSLQTDNNDDRHIT